MCLVHVATPLYTNHCFVSCKYKTLKSVAPKRQFCGSASNTKANSKERGSEKRPYDESPELHSSCNFCVVMVVSNGLRSTLIWSKFQTFPRRTCPQTPLEHCTIRSQSTAHYMHHSNPHSMRMPTFFNLWIPIHATTSEYLALYVVLALYCDNHILH